MNFFLYLNFFDFFVLIIFFSSLLIGLSRGLYIEIISNAIWISAILLAWFFRYYPMEIFDNFTNDKEIKSIFSFVSIFIVLLIVFRITGKAIMKGMNSMQKGLLDRIFGSFFGGLRGALIIIMMFLVGETYIITQTWWKDSYMSDYILTGADHLGSFIGRVPYEEINVEELNINEYPFN
mgnify:FL=1